MKILKTILVIIFILILSVLGISYIGFKKISSAFDCSMSPIQDVQLDSSKTASSQQGVLVLRLNEKQFNGILAKIVSQEQKPIHICGRISDGQVEVLIYANSIIWGKLDFVPVNEEPYLVVNESVILGLPGLEVINSKINDFLLQQYKLYFGGKIPAREIKNVEVKNGEILFYTVPIAK